MPIVRIRGLMRVMRARPFILTGGFLIATIGGYFLAKSAAPEPIAKSPAAEPGKKRALLPHEIPHADPIFRKGERPAFQSDREAMEAGALVGQRSLVFKDRAAMEAFLAKAGNRVRVIGRIDALFALRLGFLNYADLADLLDGSEEIGMIFSVTLPESESIGAQPGAVPMGSDLLRWLGINGDNSTWGAGVKIAVLDTGVNQHPAFGGKVITLSGGADQNGHGTAVTSIYAGNTTLLPGVSPGTTTLSFQVADPSGYATTFDIAQAIMAAIEAGSQFIVIMLGGEGESAILRNAVAKANEAGIPIIAPVGNTGGPRVLFPAGYEGVIGVGAVDKTGERMQFSNTGDVDLAAPGYGLNAGWFDGGAVSVSGTSFSGPVVAGMASALVSELKITGPQAIQLIMDNLNDAGAPGPDPEFGHGIPNMERILSAKTPGIYDAAVASHWVDPENPSQMLVTIQNQGTEPLVNTNLQVTGPQGTNFFNAAVLKVGGIQTFTVPIYPSGDGEAITFQSKVTVSGGQGDARPANNLKVESFTPPSSQ